MTRLGLNVPNLITLTRLMSVPLMIWLIVSERFGAAFCVFAGAGVTGGQVIGKSDRLGAYPVTRAFGPPDLAATIYSALGVDPATELRDRLGRPIRLCSGQPIDPIYSATAV